MLGRFEIHSEFWDSPSPCLEEGEREGGRMDGQAGRHASFVHRSGMWYPLITSRSVKSSFKHHGQQDVSWQFFQIGSTVCHVPSTVQQANTSSASF